MNIKIFALLILVLGVSNGAQAQESAPAQPPAQQGIVRAYDLCASQAGLELGQKPNRTQRKTIHTCARQAFKEAYGKCAGRVGVNLTEGQRPSAEQRQQLKQKHQAFAACMKKSGFGKGWNHPARK